MTKVTRALSQFLVTSDYRIVANDLDDLPEGKALDIINLVLHFFQSSYNFDYLDLGCR